MLLFFISIIIKIAFEWTPLRWVNIWELCIIGEQRVGNKKADPKPDIVLSGLR